MSYQLSGKKDKKRLECTKYKCYNGYVIASKNHRMSKL